MLKKIITISLFFLVFSCVILIKMPLYHTYAQDSESEQIQELMQGPSQEDLKQDKLALAPKRIRIIEVKGNETISTNTIISKMKSRAGALYMENVISDDIKRLYLLGFFSDINVSTEDYDDGLKLIITVIERPIIETISFEGIKRFFMKQDKLKKLIGLKSKEKQHLDYPTLKEDVLAIKKLYEKKGFSDAEVDYKVDISREDNSAHVIFVVQEGKRVRIKRINVEGNKHYSRGRILKLMKTKSAWLFNAGVLKEDVLAEDIERIVSFYRREGFADVEVEYELARDAKKPLLFLNIKIEEGKRYLVGEVKIIGNENISQDLILGKLLKTIPDSVFSEDGLKLDTANIQSIYFDRGYIFVRVDASTSLNPKTDKVDVVYTIVENEIAYVDKIKIRGNIKTKDIVIRRELRIYPGDRFDGDKLRRSKERLQNLGFFEELSYDTEPGESPNKRDLVVEVKEAKTGSFSFGGGYSSVDQFVGFIEIEQNNFDWKNFPYFTGDGQILKLRASFGSISDMYSLSFTEPWIFDYPLSFGFDLYKFQRERESDVGYGYDEDRTGGNIRLGKDITEYLSANLTYKYEIIDISDVPFDATNDLQKEVGENHVSSMQFGLSYDKRDNVFVPTRGYLLSGSMENAGGPFGGDKDFMKFYGRASKYFPLFNNSVLEFRARAGVADPYGDSDEVPIYERFFAGGAYTVRGYEERKIGPIDPVTEDPLGGEAMLIGNIEYTYPLLDFLRIALFFDTGNVWRRMEDFGSGDFKSSIGVGARIKTPIGPISLDYGIPLDKQTGEEDRSDGRFHFSISHGF